MHFFVGKRRQTPTVIIVALIDVLIVLLIFLMVTTTFKQQQLVLKLSLPESSQAEKKGASENAPLLVSIDAKGVTRLGTEALPVTNQQLKEAMDARVARNPGLKIAISADKAAPFGQFLKVRDAAIEAKVQSILVYTKEPGEP
jgi:biopolymer transport protein ExbD